MNSINVRHDDEDDEIVDFNHVKVVSNQKQI